MSLPGLLFVPRSGAKFMITPPIQYYVVDAFTDRPFAGNPAAVVPLQQWREDQWLQNMEEGVRP